MKIDKKSEFIIIGVVILSLALLAISLSGAQIGKSQCENVECLDGCVGTDWHHDGVCIPTKEGPICEYKIDYNSTDCGWVKPVYLEVSSSIHRGYSDSLIAGLNFLSLTNPNIQRTYQEQGIAVKDYTYEVCVWPKNNPADQICSNVPFSLQRGESKKVFTTVEVPQGRFNEYQVFTKVIYEGKLIGSREASWSITKKSTRKPSISIVG